VTVRVITVASRGIFRVSAPNLVAAVAVDSVVVVAAGPLPAITAMRRDTCLGNVPKEVADVVVAAAAVVAATATTAINPAISLVIAPSQDRGAAAAAEVVLADPAITVDNPDIFPATVRSRARVVVVVVVAADATTCNAIVARGTGISLAIVPSEFQLEMLQAFSIVRYKGLLKPLSKM